MSNNFIKFNSSATSIFFLVDVNMQSCQHQLIWRKGERPERSLKGANAMANVMANLNANVMANLNANANAAVEAVVEEVVEDPFKQFNKSKREEASEKISERHLMGQLTQNPFLLNIDYVADSMVQDPFLKPQNTAAPKT